MVRSVLNMFYTASNNEVSTWGNTVLKLFMCLELFGLVFFSKKSYQPFKVFPHAFTQMQIADALFNSRNQTDDDYG